MKEQFIEEIGISAETLYQFNRIPYAALSPDGTQVVYTVERIKRKMEKKLQDLWMVDADGQSKPKQFTSGQTSDSAPCWSPDGQTIAFTSNRDLDYKEQRQICLIAADGGEANTLTNIAGNIGQIAWSPDGKQIAFLFTPLDAHQQAMRDDDDTRKLGIVAHHIKTTWYKLDGVGFLPENKPHLYVVDVESGETKALTAGDFHIYGFGWSPDGMQIGLIANTHPQADLNRHDEQLYTIPVDLDNAAEPVTPDQLTQITDHPGVMYGQVAWSPDGKQIAFFAASGVGKYSYMANRRLYVVPSDGGEAVDLTAEHDVYVGQDTAGDVAGGGAIQGVWWTADSQSLITILSRHGQQPIVKFGVDGTLEQIAEGMNHVVGMHDGTLAVHRPTMTDPGNLFMFDGDWTRLTNQFEWWHDEYPLKGFEEIWFEGLDGYRLQGWILTPPNFDPAQTYPTIIEIHGGPAAQYGELFMHEFHYLASQGYVVAFSNPRGGQGYGEAHCQAICGQFGTVDLDDVMAFTDVIARLDYVDSDRMGVTGGSYGGYMTALLIGHTDRFKAAVAQRSVTNWVSMSGSSDFNIDASEFIGAPQVWEDVQGQWEASPMSRLKGATTPTLVIHSMMDLRCAYEQSEQLFTALRYMGVETELVLFPDEPHGLSRMGRTDRRVVRLRHILRWFNRYLKSSG